MVRFLFVVMLAGLVIPLALLPTATAAAPKAKAVDLVICLDTSNSMDNLIASAKIKLWDIVNDLGRGKPTPNLRVALFSYGNDTYDAKIGWVRLDVPLTSDLDEVYKKLNALTTQGGEEYVARVCRDALEQLKWSEEKDALKLLFVCGNEPASQDPLLKLATVAESAKTKGIVINPIYCGNPADEDARDWKSLATLAKGRFTSISQDKGTLAIATPVDKELADLSSKLNTTYVCYGAAAKEKAANQKAQDDNAAKLAAPVAAARAGVKGGALYRNEDWDLVDCLKKDPKFDVKKVADAELSEELRRMKPEAREAHVKAMAAKRDEIQKQIAELSTKRADYVREALKQNSGKADQAFDAAVRATIREQAAAKGLAVPE